MTDDTFLRDLLGGRLGNRGQDDRQVRSSPLSRERRVKLLTAASQTIAATKTVLDVFDDVLQELAAEMSEADPCRPANTGEGDPPGPTQPRTQGEVKLTYDIRSEASPHREEDHEPIRLDGDSASEGS